MSVFVHESLDESLVVCVNDSGEMRIVFCASGLSLVIVQIVGDIPEAALEVGYVIRSAKRYAARWRGCQAGICTVKGNAEFWEISKNESIVIP